LRSGLKNPQGACFQGKHKEPVDPKTRDTNSDMAGGAGSGGAAAPSTAPTAAPVVAGTDAPKPYGPAQTTDPNASPDYYGY